MAMLAMATLMMVTMMVFNEFEGDADDRVHGHSNDDDCGHVADHDVGDGDVGDDPDHDAGGLG